MKIAILVLFLTLTSGTPGARAPAQEATEAQVKAAFLYKFVKFVDWPSEAFSDNRAPIIVGLVGEDFITSAIDQTISGKIANGRRVLVKRFSNFRAMTRCHVLFISSSQRDNLPQILAAAGSAVLTVGETEGFVHMGGIINFTIVDNKLRFEISQLAGERAGLKISAKLLNLGRQTRN